MFSYQTQIDLTMKKENLETYISKFKGTESSFPFGPEALVFKVMGKMFALVSQGEETPRLTVKCVPEDGAMLVGQHEGVVPGYYMNKKHWITISLTGELSDDLLCELISDSYKLVVSKLTKKDQNKLESI